MIRDVNPFVSCPFNPLHRVSQSRLQAHIVKCEKNYPNYKACPYNATHRFPEPEYTAHVTDCKARYAVFPENTSTKAANLPKPKPILENEFISKDDPEYEDWDD